MILDEMAEFLRDGGGVSGDMDRLQAVGFPGSQGESAFGKAEDIGQKLDSRFIGLALFRLRPDFDLQRHFPVRAPIQPGNFLARRFGRHAQEEKAALGIGPEGEWAQNSRTP